MKIPIAEMYTYVLYDSKYDLYKIGRSSNPFERFKELCEKGVTRPVAIFPKDVELQLHHMFVENRVRHPEEGRSGVTEFFKRGGKFDAFVAKIDEDAHEIPFLTPSALVTAMRGGGKLFFDDPVVQWNFDSDMLSAHKVALALLDVIGKMKGDRLIDVINIGLLKGKLAITENLFDDILAKYSIMLYFGDGAARPEAEDGLVRTVTLDGDKVDVVISLGNI